MDYPYSFQAPRRVRIRTRKGGKPVASSVSASGAQTTGDVADILEAKYHVMEIFYEENQQVIANAIGEAITDAMDMIMDRGEIPASIFPAEGIGDIQESFTRFINERIMDGIQPGVPTKAAQKGVNHRLAHPYAKGNPERPSFKDTGEYMQSFRAWIDE